MKNPTTKGRVSRVSLASITPETLILSTYRAQCLASRFALPLETAAIMAALAFAGGAHG